MINVDTSELEELAKGFARYQNILPKSVANSAFRNAVKPMLQKVKSEVPVGKVKAPNGWGRYTGRDYARGGYTKRDARIKVIPAKTGAGEIVRGFVGISMKRGSRVGWRTHFITHGWTDRAGKKHGGNDFLSRSFTATIGIANGIFGIEVSKSFQKWAKANLPQRK